MITEKEFKILGDLIERDIAGLSSTPEHIFHKYLKGFGLSILPFVIRDLENRPLLWLKFLRELTKTNPVKPENCGNIKLMAKDWIEWALENYYIDF